MTLGTFLAGPITQLRGLSWLSFTDTGHVGTGTATDDAGGGAATTWVYGTGVPCRVDPLTSDESVGGGRLSDRSTHVMHAPAGTVITTGNRFSVDGMGVFVVTAVHTRSDEMNMVFEVVAS